MATLPNTFHTEGYKNLSIEPMKTIGVQDLLRDDDYIAHVGWLYKRDNPKPSKSIDSRLRSMVTIVRSPWKNYYIVVHKGSVYVYNNDESKKPRACFSLAGYLRVMRAEDVASPVGKSFTFKLIHTSADKKTWYFATGSHRELQLWMAVVKSEMEKISEGEVSRQTQKLVIGLKRPSLKQSLDTISLDSISLDDTDAIYNALEVGVIRSDNHNYNDIGSSDEESDSDDSYESPIDETADEELDKRRSVVARPLPPTPGVDISTRPPAKIPTGSSNTLPGQVLPENRPQMPLPTTLPSGAKPLSPKGAMQLPPTSLSSGAKPISPMGAMQLPTTSAPKLRPWEHQNKRPEVAPRPTGPAPGPIGGVKMTDISNIKLRQVTNKPIELNAHNSEGPPTREAPRPEPKKRPEIPLGRPKLPTRPKEELLPASANLASPDKALAESYLNEECVPGMYLVRESRDPGTCVVVVFDGPRRSCLHYKVFTKNQLMYLQPDDPSFSTLEEMLKYYKSHPLPTTNQKLTKPYQG
ncbi:uncharacterized protein LOC144446496 [Glandiceps talaboti]